MKKEIIIFIVGLLLGAIISTGSIYIYTLFSNNSNNNQAIQMPSDNNMQMNNNGNTPPDMQTNTNNS